MEFFRILLTAAQLQEGKAFDIDGRRWHMDCFRCNTCHTLQDTESDLLLLGDGSIICTDCSIPCSVCHKTIEDLAILVTDRTLCADCFRCTKCDRKIEDLRCVNTPGGIICEPCNQASQTSNGAGRNKRALANPLYTPPLGNSTPSVLPPEVQLSESLPGLGESSSPTAFKIKETTSGWRLSAKQTEKNDR